LLPAARHRLFAQIDSTRGNARVAHHLQKFAASTADIEHGAAVPEPRQIELDVLLDVLLCPAKTFGKTAVIELRRLERSRRWRWRSRRQLPYPLPNNAQLFVDNALVFAPHLPHFFPEPLLGLEDRTLEGDKVIGVLRPGNIAEVRFHERSAV